MNGFGESEPLEIVAMFAVSFLIALAAVPITGWLMRRFPGRYPGLRFSALCLDVAVLCFCAAWLIDWMV